MYDINFNPLGMINIFIGGMLNFSFINRDQKKSVLVHFQNILYVF